MGVGQRAVHEDRHPAAAHLGARHAQQAGAGRLQVAAQAGPRDAVRDDLLQRREVQQAAHGGPGVAIVRPRDARQAQRAQRQPQEIAQREPNHVAQLHPAPHVADHPRALLRGQVRAGRQVGGVDRAHRRAAHQIELEGPAQTRVDVLEEVGEHARFVGAAGASTGENDRNATRGAGHEARSTLPQAPAGGNGCAASPPRRGLNGAGARTDREGAEAAQELPSTMTLSSHPREGEAPLRVLLLEPDPAEAGTPDGGARSRPALCGSARSGDRDRPGPGGRGRRRLRRGAGGTDGRRRRRLGGGAHPHAGRDSGGLPGRPAESGTRPGRAAPRGPRLPAALRVHHPAAGAQPGPRRGARPAAERAGGPAPARALPGQPRPAHRTSQPLLLRGPAAPGGDTGGTAPVQPGRAVPGPGPLPARQRHHRLLGRRRAAGAGGRAPGPRPAPRRPGGPGGGRRVHGAPGHAAPRPGCVGRGAQAPRPAEAGLPGGGARVLGDAQHRDLDLSARRVPSPRRWCAAPTRPCAR